ncbi:hypothetical protein D9619_012772 [Psilocybe cf. subviscida]|uniref:Uncharacterized protein n=1 Tax=Psilocybe cf. subviscida TaxID=2480587 RepID=A0A8H5AQL3_9AGAR|nr:hypothetical protein D9619_012772 [Psilocybe cf. subviscida]
MTSMYNYTSNESSQRRQPEYGPPRYAVDGGRIFSVSGQQNNQTNGDGGRSNAITRNSVSGGMYIGQATHSVGFHTTPSLSFAIFTKPTQSSSNIPVPTNQNQSTGQRIMASSSTTGMDYRSIAPPPASVLAVQQQRQLVMPPDQQRRLASYFSVPEQHHPQHVRQHQPAPPSNWPPPPPAPPFASSGLQQRSVGSSSYTGYVAPPPTQAPSSSSYTQDYAAPPPQILSAQAPPSLFPNPGTPTQSTFSRETPAAAFASSSVALPSTPGGPAPSASSNPVVSLPSTPVREPATPFPLPTVSEAEAALLPVRGALESLWRTMSSAHTTALAKERDAHIASVKELNAERKANAQLQARLQAQIQIEQELRNAAKGAAKQLSMPEEMIRRVRGAVDAAREEGCKQGRKDGRQELNTLQLDFEGVQTELSDQKNLVMSLKAETERLRCSLRASDRLVAYSHQEMMKLLLEIPPTRHQAVPLQSAEDMERMHALLQGVEVVQDKLSKHRQAKRRVTDLVQMVNMELLALVDTWTRRGADALLSSRWKKAWTTAAVDGQGGLPSARKRTSTPASSKSTAAHIASRKDSKATQPSLLVHSRNASIPASASPFVSPVISRKVSIGSSAAPISTPSLSSSTTAPPVSGSSHATPIDVDLEDACDQLSSTTPGHISKPPSPTTKYRSLLDFIAEARQDFGLPKTSKTPSTATYADADTLASAPAEQDYRSAYGLMALPPTPRDFNDPDLGDLDYDTHSVPRLSPPAENNMPADQEPSSSEWEQRGWRPRTPPPTSTPVSPVTLAKEISSHVPSSPCLLKDAMPLRRVDLTEASSASPMIIDAIAPLGLGVVSVPPVTGTNDAVPGSVTSGKRTRAEFEEGQGIHGCGESDSRGGSFEAGRKRRAPLRPSLPPTLVKPEPVDAVFDQTAALSLDGTPAPEGEPEMEELEGDDGGANTTEVALKQELVDEAMLSHDSLEPSPEPASALERGPRISDSATFPTPPPSMVMDDLEEGEITPDVSAQRTPTVHSTPPSLPPAVAANVPSTANSARKQRPIPDMVRRTRPSDDPQVLVTTASAIHTQSSPRPPKPKYTKLGISHIDLLYRTQGNDLVCRMCETRPRDGEKKTLTGARYPENAPWDTLIGHCWRDHPVACEELERKKPSDIAEIKQRLQGARFGRS